MGLVCVCFVFEARRGEVNAFIIRRLDAGRTTFGRSVMASAVIGWTKALWLSLGSKQDNLREHPPGPQGSSPRASIISPDPTNISHATMLSSRALQMSASMLRAPVARGSAQKIFNQTRGLRLQATPKLRMPVPVSYLRLTRKRANEKYS